ncbi:MAG: hypothetical protein KDC35_03485 [Acidobacteria bacterium]|nr:hypothetical protein [Acidobacteriota bacterium]
MLLITGPGLIGIVVLLAVVSYAAGYFQVRRNTDSDFLSGELPSDKDGCVAAVFTAYGHEASAVLERNHSRRHAEKRLREFGLASIHFVVFTTTTALTASIERLEAGYGASLVLLGLTLMAMALKAGQLTGAHEDLSNRERLLVHLSNRIRELREHAFKHVPSDLWSTLMAAREDKFLDKY